MDHEDTPAKRFELLACGLVPSPVAGELVPPEFGACPGKLEVTAIVHVPETAMHKNNRFPFRQDEVGFARQALVVQPEPEALCVEKAADLQFGLGVLAPDAGHHPASGRRIDDVGHAATATGSSRA